MSGPLLLFPGSFDPPHLGHVDLATRAAAIAGSGGGRLLIGVAVHPDKLGLLSLDRRVKLLQAVTAPLGNVEIATYPDATVQFAKARGVTALIRGLRHHLDLEDERAMAEVNRQHGLDTLFLLTAPQHAHLSSRLVRSARAAGLALDNLVPPPVAAALAAL